MRIIDLKRKKGNKRFIKKNRKQKNKTNASLKNKNSDRKPTSLTLLASIRIGVKNLMIRNCNMTMTNLDKKNNTCITFVYNNA